MLPGQHARHARDGRRCGKIDGADASDRSADGGRASGIMMRGLERAAKRAAQQGRDKRDGQPHYAKRVKREALPGLGERKARDLADAVIAAQNR